MKIIGVSNFNLESESDIVIAENVNSYYGKKIVNFLVDTMHESATYFPKLVEDDYELYQFKC